MSEPALQRERRSMPALRYVPNLSDPAGKHFQVMWCATKHFPYACADGAIHKVQCPPNVPTVVRHMSEVKNAHEPFRRRAEKDIAAQTTGACTLTEP